MSVSQRTWTYKAADGAVTEGQAWQVFVRGTRPDGVDIFHRRVLRGINKPRAVEEEARVREAIRTGTYRTDAEREAEREAEAAKNKPVETFAQFWPDFLANYKGRKGRKNKPSETMQKELAFRVHLAPFFGKMSLDEIDEEQLDRYITKMQATEWTKGRTYSNKYINNHLAMLSASLRFAKRWKRIETLPMFTWLLTAKPDFDFLTRTEADQLLGGCDEEPWRTMMLFALRTGLRPSELRALQWLDVDIPGSKITVKRGEYRGVTGTPKDEDAREVPLSGDALAAIHKLPSRFKGKLVFCYPDGDGLKEHGMRLVMERTVRASKFPRPLSWYVFRHTFASWLVQNGVHLKVIGEMMGHSTTVITERYAHLAPGTAGAKENAVALLDSATIAGPAAAQQR